MSPPESKPLDTFDTPFSPRAVSQNLSLCHDAKLPPILVDRKRTQSEMDLPSPPVTPYTGSKKRKPSTSDHLDREATGGSSRDPILFPRHEPLADVATDVPLFGPVPPPSAAALVEQHINSHMARFENKLNKPTRDEYLLALSCVPIVSAQYNRNPAAWAKEERETLERQLVMMNHYDSINDYSPPLETLGGNAKALKADWKGQMLDLSNDPDRELLSPAEFNLAATLRLSCATYLCSKRRIFEARVKALNMGKEFRKTDAQQACKIDVNKASKLWTAYERVGVPTAVPGSTLISNFGFSV
ncbi:hypothetical protein EYZ11_006143 [Aspergillus tanneri]|uniref:SWIRM domain-containing protein n=1 Tax=Aspergillus tanneri TaxID=1220188 RepID=A0A4S3JGJ1_9EURO|nr:hypothetical protein EYZ11_006143 [Aspergillus tanneri]